MSIHVREDERSPHGSLVDAAMAGDRTALRALWQQHRRWVAAVLIAHKPNSADVDDLLQDVAITLLAKVHTLHAPGSFVPWLRMIALNTARLAGRRHAAGPRMIPLETGSGESDRAPWEATPKPLADHAPEGRAGVTEESRRLLELARELPEDYREPLLLRCLQELSYRQISAILGLPETTIETRIARARRMLRERATSPVGGAGASGATGTGGAFAIGLPSHPHSGGGARVGVFLDQKSGL